MAWTAPRTWMTGETVTAALMNSAIRDNFLETSAATVTTVGDIVYADAANSMNRLAIGTKAKFLRGGTIPGWSNVIEGPLTVGVEGGITGQFVVNRGSQQIFLKETDAADPADGWILSHSLTRFIIEFNDDSASTFTESLDLVEGDFILHTGDKGTQTGAVVIAADTDGTTLAVTTGGTTHLTTGSLITGGPAYVEGFYNLSLSRVAAGAAADSINILPRDDGVNVSARFRTGASEDLIPNAIPNSGDSMTIAGNFWSRFTSGNTSTWTLFLSADTSGVFEVTDASLFVRSIQYPT